MRSKAAAAITTRLESDGILVREILLRDLQLPAEYAKGLEGLPLKQKQIEQTKLEAEARKESTLQDAEAAAQAKIIATRPKSSGRKTCRKRRRIVFA